MGYIIIDRDKESQGQMRDNMRHEMRLGGYHRGGDMRRGLGGSGVSMRDSYHEGYRQGYRHGWEDNEEDMDGEYRRQRDSRERYV